MIDKIRDIAYVVVEAYTKNKTPLNDAILKVSDEIDNEEVLKRICELSNQNVYLSLFHAAGVDRSNIVFDVADFAKLKDEINKRKLAMNDYAVAPDDYRKTLTIAIVPVATEQVIDKTAAINDKYRMVAEQQCLRKLANLLEAIKTSEFQSIENNYNELVKGAMHIVHKGESIGDLAKLALRNITELGLGHTKIAEVYADVSRMMTDEGYHVVEEFTKVSSMNINRDAAILQPSKEMALSIEKVAAVNEMLNKVNRLIEGYASLIK